VGRIAELLGVTLPLKNVVQQKIALEDVEGAIPRRIPFTIDLDPQRIVWEAEERDLLREDP
jgi:hypothetical protein